MTTLFILIIIIVIIIASCTVVPMIKHPENGKYGGRIIICIAIAACFMWMLVGC